MMDDSTAEHWAESKGHWMVAKKVETMVDLMDHQMVVKLVV